MARGLIIAGTGHRPSKLGGYGFPVYADLVSFAVSILAERMPREVISGMALGWDMALADAALLTRIPLTVAIPFEGQDAKWRLLWQIHYRKIVERATTKVVVCTGGYEAWKLQKRNEWMVDHCTEVLALWNGSEGGTRNCLGYAWSIDREVTNVWEQWESMR